jgi:ATP synthase protein I
VTAPETPPTQPPPSGQAPKPLPSAAVFLGLGTAVAGCVGVGVLLGVWLDARVHTSPLFLVLGLVLGVASAVWTVVSQVRRFL